MVKRNLISLSIIGFLAIFGPESALSDDLDRSKLAVNAFVNDPRFGTISQQFLEVRDVLGLKQVRILLAWNDSIQSGPGAGINFSFYDEIVNSLPRGVRAIAVLTSVPSWMSDSANWIDGDPRKTFVELWVRKVAKRYRKKKRIIGYEVWNEPNNESDADNTTLDIQQSPENYVDMLAAARPVLKRIARRKKVIGAATTSIVQNFPETFDYNVAMAAAGAEQYMDIWAIHYYGENFERLLFGGIADFLNGISKPIWVTESGEKGVNEQLAYAELVWPFLISTVPGIARIYQYQFTEATDAGETYGLRNLTPGQTVSDLYIYLRDSKP